MKSIFYKLIVISISISGNIKANMLNHDDLIITDINNSITQYIQDKNPIVLRENWNKYKDVCTDNEYLVTPWLTLIKNKPSVFLNLWYDSPTKTDEELYSILTIAVYAIEEGYIHSNEKTAKRFVKQIKQLSTLQKSYEQTK